LKALDGVNFGLCDAFMSMGSPVFGLRPFRAARDVNLNDPKPCKDIRFPAETSYQCQNDKKSNDNANV